ncbi:hypothetical protein VTN96DRAFT_5284 [Rasamsonia emersonii]
MTTRRRIYRQQPLVKLDRIITVTIIYPRHSICAYPSGVQAMPSHASALSLSLSLFLFNALYSDIYHFARCYIYVCVCIYHPQLDWIGVFFWRRNNDYGLRWMKLMASLLLFLCCDTIQCLKLSDFSLSLSFSLTLSFLSPSFISLLVRIWLVECYVQERGTRKKDICPSSVQRLGTVHTYMYIHT